MDNNTPTTNPTDDPNTEVMDTPAETTTPAAEDDEEPRIFALGTEDAQEFVRGFLAQFFGAANEGADAPAEDAQPTYTLSLTLGDLHGLYYLLAGHDSAYKALECLRVGGLSGRLRGMAFKADAAEAMRKLAEIHGSPAEQSAWMFALGAKIANITEYVHDLGKHAADFECMHVNPF